MSADWDTPGPGPWASNASSSLGRRIAEPAPAYRTEYQRDRDRIIHCSAFRRLEYKTQVFVNHEGDLFRTRLTHTLEVCQVARTISRALRLHEDLTEAICLAHDLGHTPFGHAGQDALHDCMRSHGGFEHNLQSLRVVDLLEERYADFDGLNLCFETREGILKHCSAANARQLGQLGQRFLDRSHPGLEAQLANLADSIAYNSHDVDDGLRAGLISLEQLEQLEMTGRLLREVRSAYPGLEDRRLVYEMVRRLIGELVADVILTSRAAISTASPESPEAVRTAEHRLIRYSPAMERQQAELKQFLLHQLYRHHRVYRMVAKAQRTLRQLFDTLFEDIGLLPPRQLARTQAMEARHGDHGRARGVADYIAGMTDRFAIDEHERLFNPRRLT